MKRIETKTKKIRIPWIPGFLKPRFTFAPPELNLSDETTRRNLYVLLAIVCTLCFMGIIYLLTQEGVPAYVAGPGGVPTIIVRGIYASSIAESFAVGFLFILGLIGLYFIRSAVRTQEAVERRDMMLWLGFFLLFISVLALYLIFAVKTGRRFGI